MKNLTRKLGRIFIGAVVVLALLAIVLFIYQTIATQIDRRRIARPGEMVQLDGYRLHLSVMGAEHTGPTVILENGGGGMVPQWGWVQPEVAQFARVVAYDRPGTGWSEPPPQPLDAEGSARALHQALERQGIEPPYVLAGHSMGGLIHRVFARLYPDEVQAIVLIDPRDVTWEGVFTEAETQIPLGMYRAIGFLSNFGLTRLTGLSAAQVQGLPEESFNQAVALASTPRYFAGMPAEARYGDTAVEFLRQGEDLQEVPLIVLSGGTADESFNPDQRRGLNNLHVALAAQSALGEHRIVPGAGHLSILSQPEYAAQVTAAIRELTTAPASNPQAKE